jgi:UDP-GlcNAc:undecaprenyl-phosphate/decaprenyl-phosphate GlcNAc-1-phosphate transferase
LKIDYITNPLQAGGLIHFGLISGVVLAGLWLLGMMYTTKFLDGLDGLVAGISSIAAFFIFLVSLRWDVSLSATGLWALMLLGASLGFFIFNYRPAKIFLGEGGSVFIGFTLGVLSIISGSKITTTLLVMGLPILDVVWVVISRLLSKKSPFSGDRRHLHYRLLDFGFTRDQAVWLLWLLAIAFGALGIFSSSYGKMILVVSSIALMILISYIITINNKKRNG